MTLIYKLKLDNETIKSHDFIYRKEKKIKAKSISSKIQDKARELRVNVQNTTQCNLKYVINQGREKEKKVSSDKEYHH